MRASCFLPLLALPFGCAPAITGSGKIIEDQRALSPFSSVAVSGHLNLKLELGPEQRVVIVGDDNIVPVIEAVVSGGKLSVSSSKSYRSKEDVTVKIVVPKLDGLDLSGATDAYLSKLDGPELTVNVSGAAKVLLDGKVERLVLDLSGASEIDGFGLKAKAVNVRASGAGDVKVYASESLEVMASGAVSVEVSGDPKNVSQNVKGAASITRR